MASGSADAGPGVKRRNTTECLDALLADCEGDGFQLEFQPDAATNETNIQQITTDLRARVHCEIDSWQLAEPLDEYNKNAVLIVALYVDMQVAWDGNNDFLLARLTDLLLGKSLRAHPNGTFSYTNGAWTKIYKFTASQQTEFDCSFNRV